MSGDFCTNNAQAPSLFSNVTSRRMKLMVCETVSGNSALLQSNIWLKKGTVAWNCFTDHQLRASACYVGEEEGSLCIVCAKISRHVYQPPVDPGKSYLNITLFIQTNLLHLADQAAIVVVCVCVCVCVCVRACVRVRVCVCKLSVKVKCTCLTHTGRTYLNLS